MSKKDTALFWDTAHRYLDHHLKVIRQVSSHTIDSYRDCLNSFISFCFGKNGKGVYIRVHTKSWKKAKDKLRMLTSRSRCGSIVKTMERRKAYMRGWLNYFSIADMKNNIESLNGWLYRRIRMCSWKQWKLPRRSTVRLTKKD